MSILNKLKQLRKEFPNDQEFGTAVTKYIQSQRTCCDNPDNIVTFEDLDSHPYGWNVSGTRCKACGKNIDFDIDRS